MPKLLLLFMSTVVFLGGCSREEPPVAEPESRPAKLVTVSVGHRDLVRTFPALADAGDKAVLAFRVSGQLNKLNVSAGEIVKQGDVLAELNPDEFGLLKQQARANFQLANVQYKRMSKLRKDKVVSEQDFDKAQANYNSAKALLEQASANLSYTRLVAPYNGTVSIVNVENYEFINVNYPVMNIQTTEIIKVVFQMPDYLLRRFEKTDSAHASIIFDSFPEKSFPLQFQELDTEADPKTGSYKTTMIMNRPKDVGILPGMSGQLQLSVPSGGVNKIADSALFIVENIQYVWRVDEQGITEKVAVSIGNDGEILSGLMNGDRIVVSGVAGIQAGMKVREWIKERGL